MRGYFAVALDNPKNKINVGAAMRAAFNFGAAMLVTSGRRFGRVPTDTLHGYRHLPAITTDDVFDVLPFDCVPVAVDRVENATSLPEYKHPERAFYVFGAEDATLGLRVLARCRDRIVIPSLHSLNLAAAVNIILYDRIAKGLKP